MGEDAVEVDRWSPYAVRTSCVLRNTGERFISTEQLLKLKRKHKDDAMTGTRAQLKRTALLLRDKHLISGCFRNNAVFRLFHTLLVVTFRSQITMANPDMVSIGTEKEQF